MNTSTKKYSILNDKVVKTLLSKNESFTKEYMCRIIHKTMDIPLADLRKDLTLVHPSIPVKQDVVGSETDILYQTKDYYIDIEVNYRYSNVLESKNTIYMAQLLLRDVKSYKDYLKAKKVLQINICNYDLFGLGKFIYRSTLMEENYHKIRSDKIEIIDINLDYLRKVDYNDIKKNSLESDLYFLIEENQEILSKLYEGDEIMLSMQREVTSLMGCVDDYLYYDKDRMEQSEAYQEGRESGLAEGKKSGMAEGKKLGQMLGQKESKMAIAKIMLDAGESLKKVKLYTKLSKNELQKLINEQSK